MIGRTMLNEEIMPLRVGDMRNQSQGGYTMRVNTIMALETPWGNQGCNDNKNSRRNWTLAAKDLDKTKNYK